MIGRQCRASSKFEVVSDSISMPQHGIRTLALASLAKTLLLCLADRIPSLFTLKAPGGLVCRHLKRHFLISSIQAHRGSPFWRAILAHASHKRGLRRSLSTVSSELSQISKAKVAMSWRRAKRRSPWSPGFLDSCCHLKWWTGSTSLLLPKILKVALFVDKTLRCYNLESSKIWDFHHSSLAPLNFLIIKFLSLFGLTKGFRYAYRETVPKPAHEWKVAAAFTNVSREIRFASANDEVSNPPHSGRCSPLWKVNSV